MNEKPIRTFRSGAVGVSIWQREGKHGTFHEFTMSRSFLAREGESGYTGSFRVKDLPGLRELLDRTGQWIVEQHATVVDGKEGVDSETKPEPVANASGRDK